MLIVGQGTQSSITLYRLVHNRERYYIIRMGCNLFGEYIVLRRYGASRYTKPSREMVEVFANEQEAYSAIGVLIVGKLNKGYAQVKESTLISYRRTQ